MDNHTLKVRRKELGLSQKGLGDWLKVTPNTVARWERGERDFPGYLELAINWIERELYKELSQRKPEQVGAPKGEVVPYEHVPLDLVGRDVIHTNVPDEVRPEDEKEIVPPSEQIMSLAESLARHKKST